MKPLRLIPLCFVAGTLLLPAADPALLSLVPAGVKTIAGIDADRAKNSAFGQKLMAQAPRGREGVSGVPRSHRL